MKEKKNINMTSKKAAGKTKSSDYEELVGQYVNVHLKGLIITEMVLATNQLIQTTTFEGYLINYTDNHIYLGETLESYNLLIDVSNVGAILITEQLAPELKYFTPDEKEIQ